MSKALPTQKAASIAAIEANNGSELLDDGAIVEKGARLAGVLQITAPSFREARFHIVGIAPLVIHKFSQKALRKMTDKQEKGSQGEKGKKREPKDFNSLYEEAKHISREGWCGIPASAFRNAMISGCRLVGFKMVLAKLSVFVEADGFDVDEGTPLVKIIKGDPRPLRMAVRLATGVPDVCDRPIWDDWEAIVRMRYDNDVFSLADITNLMARVGLQVGICEGRPDSKRSAGMGWGLFKVGEVTHDGLDNGR